jgi:hypothetical protein
MICRQFVDVPIQQRVGIVRMFKLKTCTFADFLILTTPLISALHSNQYTTPTQNIRQSYD